MTTPTPPTSIHDELVQVIADLRALTRRVIALERQVRPQRRRSEIVTDADVRRRLFEQLESELVGNMTPLERLEYFRGKARVADR